MIRANRPDALYDSRDRFARIALRIACATKSRKIHHGKGFTAQGYLDFLDRCYLLLPVLGLGERNMLKKYYHHTQNDYRTELYYLQIILGNFCSVITEPNCFWNYLVSVRSVSRGLPNPLPNCFGNYLR